MTDIMEIIWRQQEEAARDRKIRLAYWKSENMEDFKAKHIVYVLRPLMSDVLSSS